MRLPSASRRLSTRNRRGKQNDDEAAGFLARARCDVCRRSVRLFPLDREWARERWRGAQNEDTHLVLSPALQVVFAGVMRKTTRLEFRRIHLSPCTSSAGRSASTTSLPTRPFPDMLSCPPRIADFSPLAGVSQAQRGPSNSPHRSTLLLISRIEAELTITSPFLQHNRASNPQREEPTKPRTKAAISSAAVSKAK